MSLSSDFKQTLLEIASEQRFEVFEVVVKCMKQEGFPNQARNIATLIKIKREIDKCGEQFDIRY